MFEFVIESPLSSVVERVTSIPPGHDEVVSSILPGGICVTVFLPILICKSQMSTLQRGMVSFSFWLSYLLRSSNKIGFTPHAAATKLDPAPKSLGTFARMYVRIY